MRPVPRYLGTFNNCANDHTPWGTYLTCEKITLHGFFGTADEAGGLDAQARYGLSTGKSVISGTSLMSVSIWPKIAGSRIAMAG
ncbi:MAG: DUF839 domain-containing protein [Thiolinea sp.]